MSRIFIFLAISTITLGEVKVNDNVTGKLSLFPVIVKNPSSFGPQAWIVWVDNRNPGKSYDIYVNGLTSNMTRWWSSDKVISRNYPGVDTFHGHRLSHTACTDDSGGIFIGYINHHNLDPYKPGIYVYRLRPDGTSPQSKPTFISPITSEFSACPSGDGGCVIAWMEKSGEKYKIKAQRLTSTGSRHPNWPDTAVTVRSDTSIAHSAKVIGSVGTSGSIDGIWVGWLEKDASNENRLSFFVKKLGLNGNSVTGKVRLQAQTAMAYFLGFALSPDDSGGVWTAWEYVYKNKISDTLYQYQWSGIYARRVRSNGSCIPADKIEVAKDEQSTYDPDSINLRPPIITIDKNRGCIVNWIQRSNPSSSWQLRVQRIRADGTIQSPWPNGGATVSNTSGNQMIPDICNDGGTGCIITWRNGKGSSADIWAQRVYEEGSQIKKWSNSGKQICGASDFQDFPRVIKSDTNHAIIVWDDNRPSPNPPWNIYARKVDINTGE